MKRIALIPFLLLGAVTCADGLQAQGVAYISSEEIFLRLPKAIEARTKLGEMQAKWMNEIQSLERRAILLRDEIETNRLLWSRQERTKKEGELRDIEGELQSIRSSKFGPGGEFEQLYQELMEPVVRIVMVAVRAEAEASGYDYVLDKSSRGLPVLFANPDHDLTYDVLVRLGVDVDESELKEREEERLQLLPESLPVEISTDIPQTLSPNPRGRVSPPTPEREDANELLRPENEEPD